MCCRVIEIKQSKLSMTIKKKEQEIQRSKQIMHITFGAKQKTIIEIRQIMLYSQTVDQNVEQILNVVKIKILRHMGNQRKQNKK